MSSDREELPEPPGPKDAIYINALRVGYGAHEFLLDFGQDYGTTEGVRFHTRLVTHPAFAKAMFSILSKSIEQYEQTYGAIPQVDGEPKDSLTRP